MFVVFAANAAVVVVLVVAVAAAAAVAHTLGPVRNPPLQKTHFLMRGTTLQPWKWM